MATKRRKVKEPEGTLEPRAVEPPSGHDAPGCPVVGIGASAGGLAAFEAFFSGMPADTDPGMAFVLVQHLAPDHKSILTELVKRYTRMKVFEVADGMAVKPNCAYIIPPNRDMALLNGTLQLLEPAAPRGHRLPIDFFFRSLAQDQRERAIGIVLSGTGSDGTQGVRAIKGEGGMAMAQNPKSTEYDGMPTQRHCHRPGGLCAAGGRDAGPTHRLRRARVRKNIPSGLSSGPQIRRRAEKDLPAVARPNRSRLFSIQAKHHRPTRRAAHGRPPNRAAGRVCPLFAADPSRCGGALSRPLDRRHQLLPRPGGVWGAPGTGHPRLFAGKPTGASIRVWVPGCSTGEEAYSLAILLQERMEELKQNFKLQVFATDIDRRAIDCARTGIYPASIAGDISPERLARFFSQEPDGSAYRIQKGIRDRVIFSEQDVIKDPPFSKLDLISCRNLLIYMGGGLQKKLFPLFHYALNPGGMLFLGTSETVGEFVDLFATLDRKSKLYQRKEEARRRTPHWVSPASVGRWTRRTCLREGTW